ncbi:MAG TPA: hypothetical protein VGO11_18105 [Chthoniobacteraceae bacterium]|jgi:hypothetical protein|nr:hypothetical protein [Chthoniobacteraceae bacterium]
MRKTALILALVALLPCGCRRQHISRANIKVVEDAFAEAEAGRRGRDAAVTAKEVESVLGPPHRVDPPETALRDVEVYRYSYHQGANTFQFHFLNGRLIKIESSATPPPTAEAETKS